MDFSKHLYSFEEFSTKQFGKGRVDRLYVNDSDFNSVLFVNFKGILTVSGDFGNWVFDREFIPSEKNQYCIPYMNEKLRKSSEQSAGEFDSEATVASLKKRVTEILSEHFPDKIEKLEQREATLEDRSFFQEAVILFQTLKYQNTTSVENDMKELDWILDLWSKSDNWIEYVASAMSEMPGHLSSDSIIVENKMHFGLAVVYKAFDEICKRIAREK